MVKRILFICKHNLFRSRIAEELFNKYNKNENYKATSAGIIKWDKKDLRGDAGFEAEKIVASGRGINLKVKSKGLSSSLLKKMDLAVIVADDVSRKIFRDKSFSGRTLAWKIPDVKEKDKNKEEVARKTIEYIDRKIKNLVRNLK